MSTSIGNVISDTLSQPAPAMAYYLSRRLALVYPGKAIFEGTSGAFNLYAYREAGLCDMAVNEGTHSQRTIHWLGAEHGHVERAQQTLFDVAWEGAHFQVLVMHWHDQLSPAYHYCIVAESMEAAQRFHGAVCEWNTRVSEDVILVWDVNGWNRDEALFTAIKAATLDNLVLRGTLKTDIVDDLSRFFAARETYAEYGVPWKRGILFVGPAGNGKTHTVKALINHLEQTCLYVKTFGGGGPDEMAIRAIFQQARGSAPCVLVLEDLDSLITPHNRSYFLNELDGFAENDGILTLATTNHPERLDPAILDRPSRFDRKYPFDLPALEERTAYIELWNGTLRPALRLSGDGAVQVAAQTEGFSFAYLKELFLSAMMRWISSAQGGAMDGVMLEQAEVLRRHMASVAELPSDPGYATQFAPVHLRGGPARFGQPLAAAHHVNPNDVPL